MVFLCNAFNDPSNPWYYVIGAAFLIVLFGALAAYIVLTGKKDKGKDKESDGGEKDNDQSQPTPDAPETEQTDETTKEENVN